MNRKTGILILIFLILGAFVYFQEESRKQERNKAPEEVGILFPEFQPEAVSKMVFSSFGGSVELLNESGSWFVIEEDKKHPADEEAVQKVLDTTAELEAVKLVSRNPEKHVMFQVNSAMETQVSGTDGQQKPMTMGTMGTEVQLKNSDGKNLAHFYIGKNGSVDFMTTFIRKADSDNVLLTNGYLKMIYGKGSASAWKDLVICEIEPEKLQQIEIDGTEKIVLEKSPDPEDPSVEPEEIWTMTTPDRGQIESPLLQRITGQFRRFRASDFATVLDDENGYGFHEPTATIKVTLVDDTQKEFLFGASADEKANQYYFKEAGNETVYLVPKYRLESIQKSPDDFFEQK